MEEEDRVCVSVHVCVCEHARICICVRTPLVCVCSGRLSWLKGSGWRFEEMSRENERSKTWTQLHKEKD